MSRPESLNNPETQNNSPSQQRDYSVYVNKYENYHKNYSNAQELINKQSIDIQQSQEQKELERGQIIQETKEGLDKEAIINEAKTILYENLGINENLESNGMMKKFLKGVVDGVILDNTDLAIEVINTKGKIILEALKQLATWEGIKGAIKALKQSIWELLTGNAYEKGKAVADLGLVATGVGAGVAVSKKAIKFGMKEAVKLSKGRLKKEAIVESPNVKQIITETTKKVEVVVPKQTMDFEKLLVKDIAELGDSDRVLAGEFYLGEKLTLEQHKAILKAHYTGMLDEIGEYSKLDKIKKYNILRKEGGFTEDQARVLMEKRICGKLPEKVAKIDLPEVKSDIEDWIKNKRETGGKFEVDPKKLERAFEALKQVGLPEDYLKLLRGAGIDDISILNKYKNWLVDPDYRKHIESIAKKRGLTLIEAHIIHGYTNKIFINEINGFLRQNPIRQFTSIEIGNLQKIIKIFDDGLNKMPNAPEKVLLRGDDLQLRLEGKPVKLDGYTSVANNIDDTFIKDSKFLVEIEVIPGKAKDITELAFFTNFADKIGRPLTNNEGIILRGGEVVVENIENNFEIRLKNGIIKEITKVTVKQTK